jgi:hypothetical protein
LTELLAAIAAGTGLNLVILLYWSFTLGKLFQKVEDIDKKGCGFRRNGGAMGGC